MEARGLKKHFPVTRGLLISRAVGWIKAVDGVSFQVQQGQTLGLVGESGCGKSTTAKRREYRSSVQIVFQDPWSSHNPRMRVRDLIAEPMVINWQMSRHEMQERVTQLLRDVGLSTYHSNLYPHEFSGGQRQRLAIAQGLSLSPEVIVLDEPVSALDVSIRAQIMNLLKDLQKAYNSAICSLPTTWPRCGYMCHKVAVMYLGQLVEFADSKQLFDNPLHPYTKALMSAALPSHPDIQQEEMILTGEASSPLNPPAGCRFHPRYPFAMNRCTMEVPVEKEVEPGHPVSCHLF